MSTNSVIETAAYMRAAEVCAENAYKGREDDDPNQYAVGYRDAGSNFAIAILALIPQDGRTQLEELINEAVAETYWTFVSPNPMTPELAAIARAIVTNLIGVPPLNSETVSGEE